MIDFNNHIRLNWYFKRSVLKEICILILFVIVCNIKCASFQNTMETFNKYLFLKKQYKYMTKECYDLVEKYSKEKGINEFLIYSLIEFESANHWKTNYNWKKMKTVKSHTLATGPMQIMPCHVIGWNNYLYVERMHRKGKWFKFRNKWWKNKHQVYSYYVYPVLEKPEINIQKGINYLKICIRTSHKRKYKHNIKESLRMYNAGTGSIRKNYPDSLWKNYVNKITYKYEQVQQSYHKKVVAI